jgi:hypothetical protein
MTERIKGVHRAAPLFFGGLTLASVVVLLLSDAAPRLFAANAHRILGALPLALIAAAYLAYEWARRPSAGELVKGALLAIAFLFWAANQYWADSPYATLYNDIAIALFVLDVFFVIAGWPASSPDESFGESYKEGGD